VSADELGLDAVEIEQLNGLRVLPGGHLDLVPPRPQDLDQGTENEHVRGRRHVHPDPHPARRNQPTMVERREAGSTRSAPRRSRANAGRSPAYRCSVAT
jgi:hypothetical protein